MRAELATNLMLDKQFFVENPPQQFFGNQKFIAETVAFVLEFVFSIRQVAALLCRLPSPHTNQQWIQIRRNLFNVGSIFHPSNERRNKSAKLFPSSSVLYGGVFVVSR